MIPKFKVFQVNIDDPQKLYSNIKYTIRTI